MEDLLAAWQQAEQAMADGDWAEACGWLFQARRKHMGKQAGSAKSIAKGLLGALREAYDNIFNPWMGGASSQDAPPDPAVERWFAQALPLVCQVFEHLLQTYQAALRQRQALDFDDLEAGAAHLLAQPEIGRLWQQEVSALLVDEFQDTNARQREIVRCLCGPQAGRLFVVGDARQSIYRFRRADVTVFRRLQQEIRARGGLVVDLNLTYRAHAALLEATGDLLARVMGDQPDPQRPYYVPFAPLHSDHEAPRSHAQAPFIEFILGGGEEAETARPAAAQALAQRLLELRQAGQIQRWDEVALLFRASTGFPAYEAAFEAGGIPFVTVAGQGFYNRPEIRDVLNLLRALADPWDDLAMAGLLRSPAFGLSDTALYQLRWNGAVTQPYWLALQGDLGRLGEADQEYARRALGILNELLPLVDTLPVADLLKRLVDRVDYRAILATAGSLNGPTGEGPAAANSAGAAERLWRNLDKLLADAQASRMVNLRRFLEYLDSLRDVGAREGEAPAEAEGAVRLMSIHKAKGLEFPVVVLADAARRPHNTGAPAYLLPETGLAFKLDQPETPLLYRMARGQDARQGQAEEKRLLYVALTRAKEKLLISGHCTATQSRWKADGWLGELLEAGGVDLATAFDAGQALETATPSGRPLRVWACSGESPAVNVAAPAAGPWPELPGEPLYRPLEAATAQAAAAEPDTMTAVDPEPAELPRPWRVTGERLRPPAEAVGRLVHHAIQRWLFPNQPQFAGYLDLAALETGLADPAQRAEAIQIAGQLLERLQRHPLWQEIEHSLERHHEVPYSHLLANRLDSGFIDLLYRTQEGWQIVDFKTDSLRGPAERGVAIERYTAQMQRYARAVQALLRQPMRVRLCFLDDQGKVSLESCP